MGGKEGVKGGEGFGVVWGSGEGSDESEVLLGEFLGGEVGLVQVGRDCAGKERFEEEIGWHGFRFRFRFALLVKKFIKTNISIGSELS